ETSGLKTLMLQFRVGYSDETLATRGRTHCCEHLALSELGEVPYTINGFVEPARTVFYAQGTDAQLVEFARVVTGALSRLPAARFPTERKVLRAESASRKLGDIDLLLRLRYGARGPGLTGYPEYGLYEAGFGEIDDWARHWFTASNAI